jgi:hypothetical protein
MTLFGLHFLTCVPPRYIHPLESLVGSKALWFWLHTGAQALAVTAFAVAWIIAVAAFPNDNCE